MTIALPHAPTWALGLLVAVACGSEEARTDDSTPPDEETCGWVDDHGCRVLCCNGPDHDTGCFLYPGPTLIDYAAVTCAGDEITASVDTVEWTSDALLDLTDSAACATSCREEEHHLPSVDYGCYGYWDLLELTLEAGVSAADAEPGARSVFACAAFDAGAMTFAVRVYDPDGLFADCAVWGHDPQGYIDGVYGSTASAPGELASCIAF